ncbi:MAG: leucine-rich repeat protein [Eubacterium sp.]|nr:leucine-rich repeat protein [Eubacterium sp.]
MKKFIALLMTFAVILTARPEAFAAVGGTGASSESADATFDGGDYCGLMEPEAVAVEEGFFEESDRADASQSDYDTALKSSSSMDWYSCENDYVYNLLDSDLKEIWDDLDALCYEFLTGTEDANSRMDGGETDYMLNGWVDMSGLTGTYAVYYRLYFLMIFKYCHPQYYFLKSNFYYEDNTYEKMSIGVYESFADGDDRAKCTADFEEAIQTALTGAEDLTEDGDKVLYFHDYIANKIGYDNSDLTDEYDETAYTQSAYSVFCTDSSVCAGYSLAYQILLNASGVTAISATSNSHAWNMVRVNDSWYEVDVCWDDTYCDSDTYGAGYTGISGTGDIVYLYYGLSESRIAQLDGTGYHKMANYWDYFGIDPARTLDTGSTETTAGTFATPTSTASAPVIYYAASGSRYTVWLSSSDTYADIYYTTDGTEPSVAETRSCIYDGTFVVSDYSSVKAMSASNTQWDSSVVSVCKVGIFTGTTFTVDGHKYRVTASTDVSGSVNTVSLVEAANVATLKVPATVEYQGVTFKVTAIAAKAAKGNSALKKVVIGKNVKTIGARAFYGCKKLRKIVIGTGVRKIGSKAFAKCVKLKNIRVKSGVISSVKKNCLLKDIKLAKIKCVTARARRLFRKAVKKAGLSAKVK